MNEKINEKNVQDAVLKICRTENGWNETMKSME
jgi:hypothetical protein